MSYLERIIRFVKRNALKNSGYFIRYALAFFNSELRLSPVYLSDEEFHEALIAGRSLIRLGDGEVYIVHHGSIHYQDFHPRLREYFLSMIQEYSKTSPYILGIPQTYLGMSNTELRQKNLFHCWLPFKVAYQMLFNARAPYFDAHLFYRDGAFANTLEGILKDKTVLLVASEKNWNAASSAEIQKHLTVEHIVCPEENAFDAFDAIVQTIRERVDGEDPDAFRVLISAGPASKALVYVLSKERIASYDLGRGIETIYTDKSLEHAI